MSSQAPLARHLQLARLVLAWERLWRLAWPIPAWISFCAGLALLDLLPRLPPWLHGLVLAGLAVGLALATARLRHFRLPGRDDAQRRLEQDSGLAHRPLSQIEDRPAALASPGADNGVAATLWRLQRDRSLALLAKLRLGPPAPGLPARDPLGLRYAPLLLLAVGLAVGRHDMADRVVRALDPGIDDGVPPALLQIWITPPAYTGLSPMMLQPGYDGDPLRIPSGSKMLAELQGSDKKARLIIDDDKLPFTRLDSQSQKLEAEITHGSSLSVRLGFRRVGRWPIAVIADQPPEIAFTAPPAARGDGRLQVKIAARDDYAVESISLVLKRQQTDGSETEIRLPGGGQKEMLLDETVDLTAHPWSGLPVTLRPVARDGAGQIGEGAAVAMILPERQFRHPIARAIAATRRQLIADPTRRMEAVKTIVEIAGRPDLFGGDLSAFLQLVTARSRLMRDHGPDAVPSVIDMLWAAAIRIEQGDLQDARDAVDQAAQALQDALNKGASDDEITRLTEQLDTAMHRLLDSLAKQAHGQSDTPNSDTNGQTLTSAQLQAMLNQLSDLAHSGARQAARQSLDALRSLLGRLSAGNGGGQSAQQWDQSQRALEALTEKQRALLDRSFKTPNASAKSDLQTESELGRQLQQLMQSLPDPNAAPALGQALRAMGQAGQALQQGQTGLAQEAEGRALDRLQEGARQLGKAQSQAAAGRDPLGRALPGSSGTDDGGVKIPSQSDLGKSREILDELRRRAGDAERPAAERDYLHRLLDKMY